MPSRAAATQQMASTAQRRAPAAGAGCWVPALAGGRGAAPWRLWGVGLSGSVCEVMSRSMRGAADRALTGRAPPLTALAPRLARRRTELGAGPRVRAVGGRGGGWEGGQGAATYAVRTAAA